MDHVEIVVESLVIAACKVNAYVDRLRFSAVLLRLAMDSGVVAISKDVLSFLEDLHYFGFRFNEAKWQHRQ